MKFLAACALVACSISAHASSVLPATSFAKLPEFESVTLSPAGDRLAVTMRVDGRVILNVLQLPALKSIGTFGLANERDVADVYWVSNDRVVFGLSYRIGNEEAEVLTGDLMAVNVDGSEVKTLLGPERNNLLVHDMNYRDWDFVDVIDDENILVSKYEISSQYMPFLYRINVKKGRKSLQLQARHRFGEFMTDHERKVRFQGGSERDAEYVLLYRASEDADWRESARYPLYGDDSNRLDPIGFGADNKQIYFRGSQDGDTEALYVVDAESGGKPRVLFRHDKFDVTGLLSSRTKGVPIGVTWEGERREWKYFEPLHPDVAVFEALRKAFAGKNLSIVDFSEDRSRAVVYAWSDVDPGAYYVFDLVKLAALARFPTRAWIKAEDMSPMKPFTIKSRDGIDLHGFLTQPKHVPPGPKKMVVMVHGGPIGVRDTWSFDSEVQWLASNGYAVLQVNFRGSGGYGRKFQGAGFGEWGGKMQDDVTDATLWAIENGHADKSSICIYGASYGAYSAMMGLVREPDLYRCGIGYVGVYDLELWQKDSLAASFAETRVYQREVVGKDPAVLRKISPASRAAEIKAPVLLVHGGEDRRAPTAQFERMRDALKGANKPVQTIYKPKEDHGFASEANRAEFFTKMVEFLDANNRN